MAPPNNQRHQLFLGSFIHSKRLDELEYLHDTAICVNTSGKIAAVEQHCNLKRAQEILLPRLAWKTEDVDVWQCQDGEFFFPGFVDTHLHAPQYANVGIFGKTTLLEWLNKYTFPMEASLSSLPKARRVYTRCIRRTLAHGTTTAAYYATISVPPTNLLADLCLALGQRAFIGRVCMDDNSPDYYRDESSEACLAATKKSIEHIRSIDPDFSLITPILTPRFAPSCTRTTLQRLGELQSEANLPLQTHISENEDELALVKKVFPESKSYADVYDAFNLLTTRTILAHAIHLSEHEADLIATRGSKVSHCPCSNSTLASGEARVRWLLSKGIDVGLGSDMSGGYSPSVLEAARQASLVSRHLAMPDHHGLSQTSTLPRSEREKVKLSVEEVLYLATRGGAKVVGLQDRIGGFEVGKEWDAQLISLGRVTDPGARGDREDPGEDEDEDVARGNVDIFGWESWDERVAKWLFNGDDRNTRMVWVKGRLVHRR